MFINGDVQKPRYYGMYMQQLIFLSILFQRLYLIVFSHLQLLFKYNKNQHMTFTLPKLLYLSIRRASLLSACSLSRKMTMSISLFLNIVVDFIMCPQLVTPPFSHTLYPVTLHSPPSWGKHCHPCTLANIMQAEECKALAQLSFICLSCCSIVMSSTCLV